MSITRGSTFENAANLSGNFMTQVKKEFQGTRLGAQELYAEMIEEQEGALWSFGLIEKQTIERRCVPDLKRLIVAVDPAVTNTEKSDETGIVVAGLGDDGNVYVLEDYSGRYSASQWSQKIIQIYHDHQADRVVAEVNQGGDLVEQVLRVSDHTVSYKPLRASVGKRQRAEPIAALYEQGRVFHVRGSLRALEDQMTHFVPGQKKSPDRLDALVWAVTELALKRRKVRVWKV
ncbi:MAG: DNA-packaging protein [Proteobacteria bacterium]|nr:DNA-packaging protein [Pseudomonadota bacterium]